MWAQIVTWVYKLFQHNPGFLPWMLRLSKSLGKQIFFKNKISVLEAEL